MNFRTFSQAVVAVSATAGTIYLVYVAINMPENTPPASMKPKVTVVQHVAKKNCNKEESDRNQGK